MTEIQRTLSYVGVAAVSLMLAGLMAPSVPKAPAQFSEVGVEFYPQFTDSSAAKQLQVIAYNPNTAESRLFGIEFKDGVWRIPSRHNYPADGKDRLAKCAASLIGLKRDTLAGQRASEHEDFEVVDPLDENSQSLKRGQRIALKDENGKTLADYIIGKQVPNRPGLFYVRRPDEKATYITKVELQLSTKFADWIEPDLLKLDGFKLRDIEIDNYSIDTERGRILGRDQSKLSRKTSADPWVLAGLDTEQSEVNQDEVRKIVSGLDDLKIVGVRPKPPSLQRDLKLAKGLRLSEATAMDLGLKGFLFAETEDGSSRLVSKEGEVTAVTDQGVMYVLHFGDVFTGTEEEIEFGFTKKEGEADDKKPDDAGNKDQKKTDDGSKSRYLFVTVQFNSDPFGPKPVKPKEPKAPQEPADRPEPKAADAAADALSPENVGPFAEYEAAKAAYETEKAGYESAVKKYEADSKSYAEKVTEGEKLVKELNARFADWYYVISATSFENLRQSRESLVKPKSADNAGKPSLPNLNLGGMN